MTSQGDPWPLNRDMGGIERFEGLYMGLGALDMDKEGDLNFTSQRNYLGIFGQEIHFKLLYKTI